jgi:hypothetical protein
VESFEALTDDVLQRIDQPIVEFHGGRASALAGAKLKKHFHVALHANNASCSDALPPRPPTKLSASDSIASIRRHRAHAAPARGTKRSEDSRLPPPERK